MLTNLELKCLLLKATLGARSSNSAHSKGNFEQFYVAEWELKCFLLKATLGTRSSNTAHCEGHFEPFDFEKFGAQVLPAEGNFGSSELKQVPLRGQL